VLVSAAGLNQALVVGESLRPVDRCWAHPGPEAVVASLETMTRTLAGAVAGYEATRAAGGPATGAQIVVLSADGKGVPAAQAGDAPAIAATTMPRAEPDRKKMAVLGAVITSSPIPAPPRRWSSRCFAIRRSPRPDPKHAGPSPSRSGCARCCRWPPPWPRPWPRRVPSRCLPWLQPKPATRPRPPAPLGVVDGRPSVSVGRCRRDPGRCPRVEILDVLHATGYLWEAVHLFHDPGSAMAQKWMKLLVLDCCAGWEPG